MREESFSLPPDRQSFQSTPRDDGMKRIERHRELWNHLRAGPPCRLMAVTFAPDDQSSCLRTLTAYYDDEIEQAIRNYAEIRASPEHWIESPYRSFAGFMARGVEKFISEADPWTEYKKRMSFREQDEADTAAAIAEVFGEATA